MFLPEAELLNIPPYTAVLWRQFVQHPYMMHNLFERGPAGPVFDSDHILNMTGKNSNLREYKVENLEELERVKSDLLNKPILFRVEVENEKNNDYVLVKVRKITSDEFAVLVNPKHPVVQDILARKLTEVAQYIKEDKSFCLKLDFSLPVIDWYHGKVDKRNSGLTTVDGDMNIFVHNCSSPDKCCLNPGYIVCCFPFWLLFGGPCYLIHRKLKCIDETYYFHGIPVVLQTEVIPRVIPWVRVHHPLLRVVAIRNLQEDPVTGAVENTHL
ncbi:uncharacterized protein LOC133194930 [Saccostrea echinata]|uniref:uncharacterized protein LOC133194930 n=1 Tax=Saccostrea echinata TaxID=191078 RepID=UPI002A811780|nr:uncharacterized protein LOC133194930 [Saccostrea echinata]